MFALVKFTDACNMACRYCCMGEKRSHARMSLDDAQKAIDVVLDYLREDCSAEKDICFHGGEPTLLGAPYLDKLWNKIRCSDPGISISMQSNLYHLSDDLLDISKKYGVKISTSIDGPKSIHDLSRVDISGNGTFDNTITNINRCRDAGIPLGIICTLNCYNWDKPNVLYQFFKQLAIPYKINWVHKIGSGENPLIHLTCEQISSAVTGMLDNFLCDDSPTIYDDTSNEFMLGIMAGQMVSCAMKGHCQKEFICIEANGDVYPCDAFSYLPNAYDYRYGNILTDGKKVFSHDQRCILAQRSSRNIPSCNSCVNQAICNGGCLLDAVGGDYQKGLSCFCNAYKNIFNFCRAIAAETLQSLSNEP